MYRTLETSTWSDPEFDGLKSSAKLLFLYFVTNEHTHASGIYHCRRLWILNETGLPQDAIEKSMDTLSAVGMCFFDPKTEVVWVKNMMKHQGQNSKLRAAARKHIKTLHNSCLIQQFLEQYPNVMKEKKPRKMDRSSVVGIQEQEQEQKSKNVGNGGKDEIEEIYQAYPSKGDKGHAIPAIKAAIKRIKGRDTNNSTDWILEQVRRYAATVLRCKEAGADIDARTPGCATWFNGFRYDDEEKEWARKLMIGVSHGPNLRIAGTQPDHRAEKRAREYPSEQREIPDLMALADEREKLAAAGVA